MRLTTNAFFAAAAALGLLIPEADQQVAAQADAFPEHEQQQEVRRQHEHAHREHEQRERGEEPRVARVAVHVAGREHRHQQAHERDHRQHDRRHRVGPQIDADVDAADVDPLITGRDRPAVPPCSVKPAGTIENSSTYAAHRRHRQPEPARQMALLAQHLRAQRRRHHRRHQRRERDQPQHKLLDVVRHSYVSCSE